MKRRYCILFFICLSKSIFAQQAPQYTQYSLNAFLINPALSGIENYTDLRFGNRMQWTGLSGAPQTKYMSMHTALGKNYLSSNANSFSGTGENPMSRSFVQSYQAAAPHHGVGIIAVADKTGPLKNTEVKLNYAYHLGISSQLNVSVGVAAGFSQVALDAANITFENPGDPFFSATSFQKVVPTLSIGTWVYGSRFYGGMAVHQLLPNRSLFLSNNNTAHSEKQQPQVLLSAGYKVSLSDDIAAFPSVLVNYMGKNATTTDANLKLAFKDKFWLGGGYRRGDSFSATAGFTLGYLLNVGYSYDFTTSRLSTVSNGSHELVLGILLNNRYRVTCPQMNW